MAMGEGGSQISFSFSLISFFFSFSEIQSPSPGPRRAAAQPRATLHGLNPDQLQAPLELHTEREEKRKKVCANVKERERERHLMTGKVFREGFTTQRHNREKWSTKVSKTQSRRISTGLDFLCSKLAGGQTSANDGSYSQTPNNQPVTIKPRHMGHDSL